MKLRIFFIALILAAQVAGIAFMSFARERERENNPTFRLQCATYDPRDLLRGHYLPLDFKILDDIPFSKFDADAQKRIRTPLMKHNGGAFDSILKGGCASRQLYYWGDAHVFWIVLAPAAKTGFWEIELVTTSDPKIDFNANPDAGKVALPATLPRYYTMHVRNPNCKTDANGKTVKMPASEQDLLFSFESPQHFFPNNRFYLAEEKAKEFDKKYRGNEERVSAELFLRDDGSPVIKRLFVDGEAF